MEITSSSTSNSESRDAIRVIKKIFVFSPILAIVASVNIYVDPACIYKNKSYEEGMARILANNRNVGGFGNCDERLLQQYLIEKNVSPEIIVLGSSRAMEIGRNVFPDKNILNNSVSGGQLLDYVGIYSVYKKNHRSPKMVLIEASPWLFNSNGDSRWESIKNDVVPMLKEIGDYPKKIRTSIVSDKLLNVLSPSYFLASLKKPQEKLTVKYFETTELELDAFSVRRADGTIAYDKKTRKKTVVDAGKEAVEYATTKDVYALGGSPRIDKGLVKFTEAFVKKLQNDGTEVVFFIPPYHPKAFQRLAAREDTKIVTMADGEVRKLAEKLGVKVFGASDPGESGLGELDFYDGMHSKAAALKVIFRKMKPVEAGKGKKTSERSML